MKNADIYQTNDAERIKKLKVASWIVCILTVIPVVVNVIFMLKQEGTGTNWVSNTTSMTLSGLCIILALSRLIMVYEGKAERPNRFSGFLTFSIVLFLLATVMSLVYIIYQINGWVRPQIFGWISILINLMILVIFVAGLGMRMFSKSGSLSC